MHGTLQRNVTIHVEGKVIIYDYGDDITYIGNWKEAPAPAKTASKAQHNNGDGTRNSGTSETSAEDNRHK